MTFSALRTNLFRLLVLLALGASSGLAQYNLVPIPLIFQPRPPFGAYLNITFGNSGDVQVNVANSFSNGSGTTANSQADQATAGPNPRRDIRLDGAVAHNPNTAPAIPGVTVTCGSSSTSCTVSSAVFTAGEGVSIPGAGPTESLSAPSVKGITVTPAAPVTSTDTGFYVASATGSTTYTYEFEYITPQCGISPASSAVTTTSGQARLGAINSGSGISITSGSRTNNVATYTVSSTSDLVANQKIHIVGTSDDNNWGGDKQIYQITSGTTFTVEDGRDTRLGAPSSGTGGTLYSFYHNHMNVPVPTGNAIQTLILGRTAGSLQVIGISEPVNSTISGDPSYMQFDDYGSTMSAPPTLPYCVATSPLSSTQPDQLTTTLTAVSGTSIRLARATSNAVSGGTILADSAPNILATATNVTTYGGHVYIAAPLTSGNVFAINSFLNLSTLGRVEIEQAGTLTLADTVEWNGSWLGVKNSTAESCPSFSIECHVPINITRGNPGIYAVSNDVAVRNVSIVTSGNAYRGVFEVAQSIPISIWENDTFSSSSGGSDYVGHLFEVWAQASAGGAAGIIFRNVAFIAGPSTVGVSTTPAATFKNVSEVTFDCVMNAHYGFFFEPNQSGLEVNWKTCDEDEGPQQSYITVYSPNNGVAGSITAQGNVEDTGTQCVFTYDNPSGGFNNYFTLTADVVPASSASNYPYVCGSGWGGVYLRGWEGPLANIGQNVNVHVLTSNQETYDGTLNQYSAGQEDNTAHQVWDLFTSTGTLAAPTCTAVTAGPPYTPAGTYTPKYWGVFPNGGYGGGGSQNGSAVASSSCTTNGTSQQLQVTIPAAMNGATSYVVGDTTSGKILTGIFSGLVFTATAVSSNQLPSLSGSGPVGMQGTQGWDYQHISSGFHDFIQQATAPSNPSSGCRMFLNSWGQMQANNSGGGNCLPNVTTSAYFNGAAYTTIPNGVMSQGNGVTITSLNTVTCPSCSFTSADVGKELMFYGGGASSADPCATNGAVGQIDQFPAGTTISSVTSGTVVVASNNAANNVSTGGCVVYGTNNDTVLSSIDTAISSATVTAGCPSLILPSGMMIIDQPHFYTNPAGCAANSPYVGGSIGGGGFQVGGTGPGATIFMLGNAFYSNISSDCVNGLSGAACFWLPQNSYWHDFSIQGGGETLTGKILSTKYLIESAGYTVMTRISAFNYAQEPTSGTYWGLFYNPSVEGPMWLDHVVLDGFGTGGFYTKSDTFTSFFDAQDYCKAAAINIAGQSFQMYGENLVLPANCTASATPLVQISSGRWYASNGSFECGTANNAVNQVYCIEALSNAQVDLIGAYINGTGGNSTSIGVIAYSGTPTIRISHSSISMPTAVNAIVTYTGTPSYYFGDANIISGFAQTTATSPVYYTSPGHSITGKCTGTVPASSTIGFYGTGANVISLACATAVGNGMVMDHPGTIVLLVANAGTGGVNSSSGVVTVLKNGSAQTSTCTLGTGTYCYDGTHQVTFTIGDVISCQVTSQPADTLANPTCEVLWQ